MEKQLMDKIRNHTTDDVDKEMIIARLRVVHKELRTHIDNVQKELEQISDFCEENGDEVKLLDFRLCFAYDDVLVHGKGHTDGIPSLCAYGAKDEIEKLIEGLKKVIDK